MPKASWKHRALEAPTTLYVDPFELGVGLPHAPPVLKLEIYEAIPGAEKREPVRALDAAADVDQVPAVDPHAFGASLHVQRRVWSRDDPEAGEREYDVVLLTALHPERAVDEVGLLAQVADLDERFDVDPIVGDRAVAEVAADVVGLDV